MVYLCLVMSIIAFLSNLLTILIFENVYHKKIEAYIKEKDSDNYFMDEYILPTIEELGERVGQLEKLLKNEDNKNKNKKYLKG